MSIIIFPILLTLTQDSSAGEFMVKNKEWTLKITSYEDGLPKIPIAGGVASIPAKENQEGVVIKGEIQPTSGNSRFVVDLKDFKLLVGDEEFKPATADIRIKVKNSLESIQWPGGQSSKLTKADFPAGISIMYLVEKKPKKVLVLSGSDPVLLSNPK